MVELKKQYNQLIKRKMNAEKYLQTATVQQLKIWLPQYHAIVRALIKLKKQIPNISSHELLNGFDIE